MGQADDPDLLRFGSAARSYPEGWPDNLNKMIEGVGIILSPSLSHTQKTPLSQRYTTFVRRHDRPRRYRQILLSILKVWDSVLEVNQEESEVGRGGQSEGRCLSLKDCLKGHSVTRDEFVILQSYQRFLINSVSSVEGQISSILTSMILSLEARFYR